MNAKSDRRVKYTKLMLKESLMGLLEKKPISKITIKEICENADINRCTFYSYYKDQYDLLEQIEDELICEINTMLSNYNYKQDATEAVQMMEQIFQYIAENSGFCRILLSEQGDVHFQKRVMVIAQRQHVIEWTTQRDMDAETAEYLYLFAVNGSIGMVQNWLKNGMNLSNRKMAEMIIKMTNQGLAAFVK